MKKIAASLAGLALAFSLGACNMPAAPAGDDDCIVQSTGLEVDDSYCENGQPGYVWTADTGEDEEDEEYEESEEEDDDHDKSKKKSSSKKTTKFGKKR